jgi:hypothetical protein
MNTTRNRFVRCPQASSPLGKASVAGLASPSPPMKGTQPMIKDPRKKVSITHINWRDDRPRFEPGPSLRQLGYKGRDLKHPSGIWFTEAEALKESQRIHAEAQSRKAAMAEGKRPAKPALPATSGPTLSQLCEALFELPAFLNPSVIDRKRVEKGLSQTTVQGYQKCSNAVQKACARLAAANNAPSLWDVPAAAINASLAQTLIHEVHAHSGLATARAVRAFLSQMWARLRKPYPMLTVNIWQQLEKLEVAQGRIRPWEPEEFWAMVEAADSMNRPELADGFFLAVLHGHRQNDRLRHVGFAQILSEPHITTTQSKTSVIIKHKVDHLLRARFAEAALRRKAHKVQWPHLLIDEQAQTPWNPAGDYYRHMFAAVRRCASVHVASCATLRDQDLRDTNQTWLDRAGVDPSIMKLVAGHSTGLSAIQKRHYVAFNQQRADAAVDLLSAYVSEHRTDVKREIEK